MESSVIYCAVMEACPSNTELPGIADIFTFNPLVWIVLGIALLPQVLVLGVLCMASPSRISIDGAALGLSACPLVFGFWSEHQNYMYQSHLYRSYAAGGYLMLAELFMYCASMPCMWLGAGLGVWLARRYAQRRVPQKRRWHTWIVGLLSAGTTLAVYAVTLSLVSYCFMLADHR